MTVFLYSRVSTGEQAKNGNSLEVQKALLEDYAKSKNFKDIEYVEDAGVSASKTKTKNRKEWAKMFGRLAPGDVVVATKLDRLFRSVSDAASTVNALRKKQVQLHLVDKNGLVAGSINDELSFNIVAAVAQFDSQLKSERIKESKQSMKKRGLWIGGKKEKGFLKRKTDDGSVVAVVDEAEKFVLEECVKWIKKRDEELAKTGKQRTSKFSAERLRMKLLEMEREFVKGKSSKLQLKMNYKKKFKTFDKRKTEIINKKIQKGKATEEDFVFNVSKFSVATLYRLISKINENNAVERLRRMDELKKKFVMQDGEIKRLKRQAKGKQVRQKALDL